jgi:hypothetical protein
MLATCNKTVIATETTETKHGLMDTMGCGNPRLQPREEHFYNEHLYTEFYKVTETVSEQEPLQWCTATPSKANIALISQKTHALKSDLQKLKNYAILCEHQHTRNCTAKMYKCT